MPRNFGKQHMKKPGPKPKNFADLRLRSVKVFLTDTELGDLDGRRAHHSRADFLRAAALDLDLPAPLTSEFVTTFSESARWRSSLTDLNNHAKNLNELRLADSESAAARALLSKIKDVNFVLDEFRSGLADAKSTRSKVST